MVVVKSNQNALPEGEQGSVIEGVSTAASPDIDYTYVRGAQYSYEGHVLLTAITSLRMITSAKITSKFTQREVKLY